MGDEPEQRVLLALGQREAAALVEFDERLVHGACAQQRRYAELPGTLDPEGLFAGHPAFAVHGFVALAGGVAVLSGHGGRRRNGLIGRQAVDLAQIVLDRRELAADAVDAHTLYALFDDAHARPGLDRLLLLRVADQQELAAGLLAQPGELQRLARGQHTGLVHDQDGVGADIDGALVDVLQEGMDGARRRIDVAGELKRDGPGDRECAHLVAFGAPEVRERPQHVRLAGARGALDEGDAPGIRRGVLDGPPLLGAEALAPVAEVLEQPRDLFRVDGVGAVRDREARDVAQRALGAERFLRREDLLVRHAGLGLDGGLRIFEGDQLGIAERHLAPALHGLAVDGAGERVLQLLHDVRDIEDGLHPRELLRNRDDLVVDFGDALVGEFLDPGIADAIPEFRDIDEFGSLLQEALDILLGRGSALGLSRTGCERRGGHLGRVGERFLAQMFGDGRNELGAPLAPQLLQITVHLADAAVLALGPVALHGDAEAFLHDVGQMAAERRACGLLPGIERIAVQGAVFAVRVRLDDIEDRRMHVQLWIALARRAVEEGRRQHVAGLNAEIHA